MRKRLIAGILSAVMVVSSLQLQTVNVTAKEMYQETEETSLAMEDADTETQKQDGENAVEDAETESGMESGTGTQGESAVEDTDSEAEAGKQEDETDNEDSKENETDDETEGESQENGEESAATEDEEAEPETAQEETDVEDTEEENIEEPSEDETEIEAVGAEMTLETSDSDIASGQYTENGSNVAWVIDANGKLTVEGTGDFAGHSRNLDNPETPWYTNAASIKSAEIKVTGMTDASFMFYNCVNLTSVDLSGFDTSEVTDMSYMFYDNGSSYGNDDDDSYYWKGEHLTNLDVSGFDTSKVTDMSYMFYGLRSLTSLDVSGFDTSKVTDMSHMFYCLRSLTSLDVSDFDTAKVKDMSYMFYGYGFDRRHQERENSLDVSGFDTGNVTNMSHMFDDCRCLTGLDVSGFNTSKVTDMSAMFYCCHRLTNVDVSGFDTGNVTDMSKLFCASGINKVDLSRFNTSKVTNMSGMFGHCNLTSVDVSSFDTGNVTDMSDMFEGCTNLSRIDISRFDTSKVTNMSSMFSWCQSLTEVDLSGLNTSNVTDMSEMFYECVNLDRVNLSGLNTSNVTDMNHMFNICLNLTRVDLSGLDTSNVTDMSFLFGSCPKLVEIDLSGLDTSNVTNMWDMFASCTSLNEIDLSSFDTSNVTNMRDMFSGCQSLISVDVSSFNTSKVTNMSGMFYGCVNLTSIDLSGLDTSNVTDMSYMFSHCTSLSNVDLSVLGAGNLVRVEYMFSGCISLVNADLSSIKTSNVNWMGNMFSGCTSLTSVDLSGFDCISFGWGNPLEDMFTNCSALITVYTPYRYNSNRQDVLTLPKNSESDVWYSCDEDETVINYSAFVLRDYSVVLTKNQVPAANAISATKANTFYEVGDTLNIDDLRVYYYDEKGAVIKVTEGYSTNANEIDMSSLGNKTLIITYNGMTAEVKITVGVAYTVTFTGTGKDDVSKGSLGTVWEGNDYKFRLKDFGGYNIYTVTAVMGGRKIELNFEYEESGFYDYKFRSYTIPDVSGNLVITIEKMYEDTSGFEVDMGCEDNTYTGSAIKPGVWGTYNGKDLVEGIDYTVKYSNNINVGTATVTVTGKGNFVKGSTKLTFEIWQREIYEATLNGASRNDEGEEVLTLASGSKLTPVLYFNNIKLTNKDFVVKDENDKEITGKTLSDSDNNTTVVIEARENGNFCGSREVTLNIVDKKSLTKFTVALDKTKLNTLTYDGEEHYIHNISGALTVTAKDAAKTKMEYGRDYTIVYPRDLINAGAKKFTVVGMGLYTGNVSKSYTIKPAKEASLDVKYDGRSITGNKINTPFTFVSSGITFNDKLSITGIGGEYLYEGADYKVSYSGNKKVGTTAKCTITFLGNYKGHAKQIVGFEIDKADLSGTEVVISDQAYKGKEGIYKSVPYVIEDKRGANVLVKSSNYKTTYYTEDPTNNESAAQMKGKNKVKSGDTVWVKLEAKGKNYSGTKVINYKVREGQDLSKAKITFKDAEGKKVNKMPYTGYKITGRHIKAVVNENLAEDDDDIEVIYVNNINKGKATVIVKGTDTENCKYAGCKTATFSIVARIFTFD